MVGDKYGLRVDREYAVESLLRAIRLVHEGLHQPVKAAASPCSAGH
jgi:hypothetical protein